MKTCIKCHEEKPAEEFYKGGTAKDGRFTECKSCNRERARLWQQRKRAANPDYEADVQLRHKYGISLVRYNELLSEQGGGCAICEATKPGGRGRRFHVDHDHACCPGGRSCGKCVRGLLCHACNVGLGAFGDDVERLTSAMAYLLSRRDVLTEVAF